MTQYLSDQEYEGFQPGDAGELAVCTDPASTGNLCLTTPDCVDGKIANALAEIELGGVINVRLITASTTITVGSGTGRLLVFVVGGGGGGSGHVGGAVNSSCGGGAGGVSIGLVTVTPAENVVCTIGNGGAAGNPTGGTGGYSLIKGIQASGGEGGVEQSAGGRGGLGQDGNPTVYPSTGLLWSKRGGAGYFSASSGLGGLGGSPFSANMNPESIANNGTVEAPGKMFHWPASSNRVDWAAAALSIGGRGCGGSGGAIGENGFAGGAGIILVIELGS